MAPVDPIRDDDISLIIFADGKNSYGRTCDKTHAFPNMWKFHGTRDIAVPITRYQPSERPNPECGSLELYSDHSIRNAQLTPTPNPRWDTPCFISGSVQITAGVMRNITGGYFVDLESDTPWDIIDIKRSSNLEPDRWINQTLSCLMFLMKSH